MTEYDKPKEDMLKFNAYRIEDAYSALDDFVQELRARNDAEHEHRDKYKSEMLKWQSVEDWINRNERVIKIFLSEML